MLGYHVTRSVHRSTYLNLGDYKLYDEDVVVYIRLFFSLNSRINKEGD
jgi:hypothetical protein